MSYQHVNSGFKGGFPVGNTYLKTQFVPYGAAYFGCVYDYGWFVHLSRPRFGRLVSVLQNGEWQEMEIWKSYNFSGLSVSGWSWDITERPSLEGEISFFQGKDLGSWTIEQRTACWITRKLPRLPLPAAPSVHPVLQQHWTAQRHWTISGSQWDC